MIKMDDPEFKNTLHTEFSKTVVKPFSLSFHWTIHNFSPFYNNDQFLSSEIFSTNTGSSNILKWKLTLYPNFKKDEYNYNSRLYNKVDYICVKLVLTSGELNERVQFVVSLLDKNNVKKYKKSCEHIFGTGKEDSVGYGGDIVKRDDLLKSDILSNDSLTILCEGVWYLPVPSKVFQSENIKMQNNFDVFLENEQFRDVTITLPDGEIKAHKVILVCRSSVFKAMFLNETKERETSHVNVEDVTLKVFNEMLTFMYTGKSPNISLIAMDLLKAADKYALLELKEMCADSICSNLSVENSTEVLKLSNLYALDDLKNKTLDFIKNHVEEMLSEFQS